MGTNKISKHQKHTKISKQKSPKHEKHKRLWKWAGGVLVGLLLLVLAFFIWFRLSAWPGAMIVRWVFDNNGAKTAKALEKHAPTSGVVSLTDQQYLAHDKDAVLDVHMPENAQATGQKLPVVIWTHGGAWVSGSKNVASPYFELLAQKGYTVVAPNYTLAPEKTYPTPVHQLNAVYAYLQENANRFRADMDKVFLAGDSAGSQLSAQMAALITNPAYAQEVGIIPNLKPGQLKGVVLTCGIYKMEELAQPSPNLSKIIGWGDDVVVWAYSGTKDFSDPVIRQMSPYYYVTKDFPPAFITGGNADPLTDVQSKPLADKLETLGVNVTELFYAPNHTPALPHEYQFNLDRSDGKKAFDQIVEFLQTHAL